MQIYSKIDIGKVRNSNQDAFYTVTLYDDAVFAIVCDGMGGANAGNIASAGAIKIITDYVLHSYNTKMDEASIYKLLNGAVSSANIELYDMSLNDPALSGMGTTVVAAIIRDDFSVVCHAGDSRAYLVTDESIVQLTRDHSMVQSLVESGKLTPEQAKVHPRKNIITRALGAEEDIVPELCSVKLSLGDTLLLCTDGLTNFVENADIFRIFKENDISKVVNLLAETANANGGGDNITVVSVTK